MSPAALALAATVALCAGFGLVFALARRLNNYGIVDIAWSYAFPAVTFFYALAAPGWWVRRTLLASLVILWGGRLGTHLLIRIAHHHPVEDGRYQRLRQDWGAGFTVRMAGFFQLQAVSVVILSGPFLWTCSNPAPAFSWIELVGGALWLLAWAGEAGADAQLAAFKREPAHRGAVCDVGLWRYSRHPNYFFEWLIWVAYFLLACGSPWGWTGILSPLSILYLLLRVTGIPMTEEQSVRSKGEAYRRYQARTSAFVPWPPRP